MQKTMLVDDDNLDDIFNNKANTTFDVEYDGEDAVPVFEEFEKELAKYYDSVTAYYDIEVAKYMHNGVYVAYCDALLQDGYIAAK